MDPSDYDDSTVDEKGSAGTRSFFGETTRGRERLRRRIEDLGGRMRYRSDPLSTCQEHSAIGQPCSCVIHAVRQGLAD
jgi:hypothetical protein